MTDNERSREILQNLQNVELGSHEEVIVQQPLPDARTEPDENADPRIGDRY